MAAAHLRGQKHMVGCKDGTILGLNFSPLEQSIRMDDLVNSYGIPVGPCCSRHLRPPPSYVVMCPPATAWSSQGPHLGVPDHLLRVLALWSWLGIPLLSFFPQQGGGIVLGRCGRWAGSLSHCTTRPVIFVACKKANKMKQNKNQAHRQNLLQRNLGSSENPLLSPKLVVDSFHEEADYTII